MTDWLQARDLFEIPDGVIYLNTAYNSPQLRSAREALQEEAAKKSRPWERSPGNFFEPAEEVRALAADLFGATSDDYAVVPSASYGISAAARVLEPELRAGDVILVADSEFPSNVLAWRRVAETTGAVLKTVQQGPDMDWTAAFQDALRSQVRVIALSAAHWTNGSPFDLQAIERVCRARGIALVLDLTQSLGAVPIDLGALDPDFAVAAGYKWLLCPYGVSLLYVSPRRQHCRPLEESWLAREGAEDFAGLTNYVDRYRPGARRFDTGEACTTLLPGAVAGLRQIKSWSVEKIVSSLDAINSEISAGLSALGLAVPSREARSPHMFGITLPEEMSARLATDLRQKGIHLSRRGSALRIAPHLHIRKGDVERFIFEFGQAVG